MGIKITPEVSAEIGGETRTLALPLSRLVDVEEATDMPVAVLAQVLTQGRLSIKHMGTIVEHGLRGGGWTGSRDQVDAWLDDLGFEPTMKLVGALMTAALAPGGEMEGANAP